MPTEAPLAWYTPAAGIAVGLVGAFWLAGWMATLLFDVPARDPWTFGGVTVLLAAVAAAASYLPAHRATRIDPLAVLQAE